MRAGVALVVGAAALAAPAMARAQTSSDDDRFFVDKVEKDGDEDKTLWQGSLTSTSFLHREVAGISEAIGNGVVGAENAAPIRYFTDLRAQVDAFHIAGKTWDARVDARARVVNTIGSADGNGPDERGTQSGFLAGNEYEVRDLYVVRGSTRSDLSVGRQTVLDVAAIKIDGVRLDYAKNRRWTYLGFAGLYPTRGSRSITTDYPRGVDGMGNVTKRVMPVAGGIGAAYRTARTYGAIGAATIIPLADDAATGTMEQPRLLVTSQGYWRRSPQLDLYHYGVLDILGAGGFALTNVSAGVNYRPQMRLRINGAYHRVDTETLNVQAQTQLENRDPSIIVGAIQNNVEVARIASDSARVSVSAALGKTMRFETTVAAAVRQRPDILLKANEGGTDQSIDAARSGEIFFQAVDRRFYGGLRLAASFVGIFGIGDNAARSKSQIVTISASREFRDGQGEWDASVGYMRGSDENRGVCTTADIPTCYGSSSVQTLTLAGTAFYRLKKDWFVIGTMELASLSLTTLDGDVAVSNPRLVGLTAFLRIAYRF